MTAPTAERTQRRADWATAYATAVECHTTGPGTAHLRVYGYSVVAYVGVDTRAEALRITVRDLLVDDEEPRVCATLVGPGGLAAAAALARELMAAYMAEHCGAPLLVSA